MSRLSRKEQRELEMGIYDLEYEVYSPGDAWVQSSEIMEDIDLYTNDTCIELYDKNVNSNIIRSIKILDSIHNADHKLEEINLALHRLRGRGILILDQNEGQLSYKRNRDFILLKMEEFDIGEFHIIDWLIML